MNSINNTINFSIDFGLLMPFIIFATALFVSYMSYPVIIKVSNLKNLMAEPNHRDVHATKTPNLGGIGIFVSIYMVINILGRYFEVSNSFNLSGALLIMFFVGLVDDLISISPKSKIIAQVLVALSISLLTDLRIDNLYGVFGIYQLPYVISLITTVFAFVAIINAYNLIDGVDGLAGSFAITLNIIFACFFYYNANYFMCFLSLGVIGALTSFLMFNFSKTKKIFMGDTGSMIIGFLLAYQAIYLISGDFNTSFEWLNSKSVIYFLAIFSFPLLDTMRVFFIRIKNGNSPFEADNNHVHHNLLAIGLKHWQIALVSAIYTVVIVATLFVFKELEINKLTFVLAIMWALSILTIDYFNLSALTMKFNMNKRIFRKENINNTITNGIAQVFTLKKSA